jgi:serine/threonine protein phosphatase PrpC
MTEANRRGGQDNITAIVVQVVRVTSPSPGGEYPALTYG